MFKRFPNPIFSTDSGQLCPSSSRWSSTLGRTLDDIFFREQKWNLASSLWQNSLKPLCSHNDTGWPCFTRIRSAKKSKSFSFLDFGRFMWKCRACQDVAALDSWLHFWNRLCLLSHPLSLSSLNSAHCKRKSVPIQLRTPFWDGSDCRAMNACLPKLIFLHLQHRALGLSCTGPLQAPCWHMRFCLCLLGKHFS